jgi:predicted MFS family arabinose efflux permease
MPLKNTNSEFILLSLWLLMFASSSQFFIMSPILSQVGSELAIPEALRGTLITAYALTLGIVALLTGPVSDRIGRRKILILGSGLMMLSLSIHQLAYDYVSMLGIRVLAGFAGGVLTGVCVAYIGDYFPKEKRGWANGVLATGSASGQVLGIPAGTLLAGEFGFAAPFQFFAFVMFAAFLMVLFFVPQPNVKLATCEIRFKKIFQGYIDLLQVPTVKTIAAGYLLMFLSITVFIVYFPTWLENEFQAGNVEIAMVFLFGGLATVFSGPISGRISDKSGRKGIIIVANILIAAIMVLSIIFMNIDSFFAYPLFFTLMLLVVSRSIPFQALASESINDESRGRLMSLTIAIGQIGMAFGSAISGLIYAEIGFLGNVMVGTMACLYMAFLINKYIHEPKLVLE